MKTKIILTLGLATLLAATTQANQQQLAQSIKDARVETAQTSEQLKATLKALNALSDQKAGDLRPAYSNYCAQVTNTEAAAAWTRARVQWMAGDGQRYFESWQATVTSISNPSLRKKAQKRLDDVKESYADVEKSLQQAGEKFKPFLSDLNDIQKFLATDVTAGGVKAVKSTISSANWNNKYVVKAINAALKEMGSMEEALSSQAD